MRRNTLLTPYKLRFTALTFSWDANHRLAKADAAAFRYDPSGYRIQKIPNVNIRTYYLEGEHLETIYDGQATPAL